MYVLRGGFMDGRPGLYYCLLMASYELFTRLKVEELGTREAEARSGASDDQSNWVPRFVSRRGPVV